MAVKKHNFAMIARLAKAEERFLRARFLAPVIAGCKTQVRIEGVSCAMAVMPGNFSGWGVFRPISHARAELERTAKLCERQQYAQVLPSMGVILLEPIDERRWLALPVQRFDSLDVENLALVHLVEDGEPFDTVRACFDGRRFWFVDFDSRHDPAASAYLREALMNKRPPREVIRLGLSAQMRVAYAIAHERQLERELAEAARAIERARQTKEGRVRSALEHAGATLKSFTEQQGAFRVTFSVDGRKHTSVVSADNLSVWSAGVCLSGMDPEFDLASLVSVLREGERRGMHHGNRV